MNRATVYGYWKTTGKDRPVMYNGEVVGMIKTLVFHQGKAPNGDRTDWVMHEYRLEEKGLADRGVVQDTYVLCVVFKKDGTGHRNGAQYGAPFKEEDWNDDDEDTDLVGTGSVFGISTLAFGGGSSSHVPESLFAEASVDPNATFSVTIDSNAPSPVVTDANAAFTCVDAPQVPAVVDTKAVLAVMEDAQLAEVLKIFTEADANNFEAPLVSDDDDIFSMLASFTEDNNLNNVLYPFE